MRHGTGLFLVLFLLFSLWGTISYCDDSLRSGPDFLLAKYHSIGDDLEKNTGPVPFRVESSANKNVTHVDIYGIINYPFEMVQHELLVPANWCDIVLPQMNVRACTYRKVNDTWILNIYNVNKFSEPLEDAFQMKFVYRVSAVQPSYFDLALAAPEGPWHSRDHQFRLEAIPLGNSITFIHLSYSFRYSAFGYFLMKIFGGSKIGFSIIGADGAGNPVYVGGLRGSAERYVAGYYLAVLAYLDALKAPDGQRYERRISQWYDLTAHFKKQLFEMKKEEYFTYKRQDRESQLKLQGDLNR